MAGARHAAAVADPLLPLFADDPDPEDEDEDEAEDEVVDDEDDALALSFAFEPLLEPASLLDEDDLLSVR